MDFLNKFLILTPVIKVLEEGSIFKKVFAWVYRIEAFFLLIFFLYASFTMWSNMGKNVKFDQFIAALLIQIFFLLWIFLVLNILLIRANSLLSLRSNTQYPLTPMMSIFIRVEAEVIASFVFSLGVSLGIASFIAGSGIMGTVPRSMSYLNSGSGLFAILYGIIISFLILFVSYYIAERISCGCIVETSRQRS